MKRPKSKRSRREPNRAPSSANGWWTRPAWIAFGIFALAALFFYWIPLTDPATTPQWDTIDYHYGV